MERIDYDCGQKERGYELIRLFLVRHLDVLSQLYGQRVIDAGCGSGLGTFIYSLVAKRILAVDKSQASINKAKKLYYICPVKFLKADLNTVKLPSADVCVCVESIEHLRPDNTFVKRLRVKKLVYTIPLDSPGPFHLTTFHTQDEVLAYIRSQGWNTISSGIEAGDNDFTRINSSVVGIAVRN